MCHHSFMHDGGHDHLADRVADTITSMTGRVWDRAARMRLTSWLDDPQHRDQALRWLTARESTDSGPEPDAGMRSNMSMQSVLAGTTGASVGGFIPSDKRRTKRSWFMRMRGSRRA